MIELKGMAWDHPRGYAPLIAASSEFTIHNPGVTIKWDVRSLKEFGDMPIESLIERYDLITIDHPYMGQADKNGLLQDLNKFVSKETLSELKNQSVGPSFDSYRYDNHTYALPIDAAALVGSYRKDLMEKYGLSIPKTKDELKQFCKDLPNNLSVAWALCPTDIWCTFLTICAQNAGRDFISEDGVDTTVGAAAIDEMKSYLEFLHPNSLQWNPIQILDNMGAEDTIVYSPYLFGYTNYSRKGYTKNIINFCDSPTNIEGISTILGGVGLAVSSKCTEPKAAAKFVEYVAGAAIQEGLFTANGGQPANTEAWNSQTNNELCSNFFADTKITMQNAYVRPQFPGWNQFQEQGADLIHEGVSKNTDSTKVVESLNELFKTIL